MLYFIFGIIRKNNIHESKIYKLIESFYNISENQISMQLTSDNDNLYTNLIFVTDYTEKEEVHILDTYYKNDKENHAISVSITNADGTDTKILFPEQKEYRSLEFDNTNKSTTYDSWYLNIEKQILENKYYTVGYEKINGKWLYFENFKKNNMKFYFDGDNLVYLKNEALDKNYNTSERLLYSANIVYNDDYKKLIDISNDYIELK